MRTRETSAHSVANLIATMTQRYPGGFPGLDALGYTPANEAERTAIVIACQCGAARVDGHVLDRDEGVLEGMQLVGAIDADDLRSRFSVLVSVAPPLEPNVYCPVCLAPPGHPCRVVKRQGGRGGSFFISHILRPTHPSRIKKAERLAQPQIEEHVCISVGTPDGHGAYCAVCGDGLA